MIKEKTQLEFSISSERVIKVYTDNFFFFSKLHLLKKYIYMY